MNRTTIKRLLVAKVRSARVNRRCRGAVGQHHLAEGRTHHHRHGSLAQRHAVAVEVRVADLPAQCGHPQANVDNDNANPTDDSARMEQTHAHQRPPSSPPASARSPPAPCCCLQPQPARPAPCTGRRCRASPSPPRSIRSDPGSFLGPAGQSTGTRSPANSAPQAVAQPGPRRHTRQPARHERPPRDRLVGRRRIPTRPHRAGQDHPPRQPGLHGAGHVADDNPRNTTNTTRRTTR